MKKVLITFIALLLGATSFYAAETDGAAETAGATETAGAAETAGAVEMAGATTTAGAAETAVPAGVPVTAGEDLKKVYDESIDPMEQIDNALVQAKATGKYVVCQVGGNWCIWCLRFADFISKDSEITDLIQINYIYLHVNYNPRTGSSEQGIALMKRLGNPSRFGFPVFVILDSEGKVIHIQDSSFLEQDRSYDRNKVLRFLKSWTPAAVGR